MKWARLPVGPQRIAVIRVARPVPGQGRDTGANGATAATVAYGDVLQCDTHAVPVRGLEKTPVAAVARGCHLKRDARPGGARPATRGIRSPGGTLLAHPHHISP